MDNQNDLLFDEIEGENPEQERLPGINNGLEEIAQPAEKKKRHMKPVPKLDVGRLLGPRGLPCLASEFRNVEFQGEGHEAEDLDELMSHLEHWAHRLYPKMMFDDCLEKIEKLGHKKEIRVCLKKIRLGMPLINTNGESTVVTEDGPVPDEVENFE